MSEQKWKQINANTIIDLNKVSAYQVHNSEGIWFFAFFVDSSYEFHSKKFKTKEEALKWFKENLEPEGFQLHEIHSLYL